MQGSRTHLLCIFAACALAIARPVRAVISINVQPIDLANSAEAVFGGTITAVNMDKHFISVKVSRPCKGRFEPTEIRILASATLTEHLLSLSEGQSIVAFVAGVAGGERMFLLYTGSGSWQMGNIPDLKRLDRWVWTSTQERFSARAASARSMARPIGCWR